jgi:polar amino acid transport system substrate-binding protein
MTSRWRALLSVVFILAGFGLLPMASPASAQQREVVVSVHDLVPFVMSQDGQRTGFTIDLWDEIAKRQQWTTKYVDVNNVSEQLRDVASKRADVAAGAISITAERMQTFDFSQPILEAGLQILAPRTNPAEPGISDFLPLLFSKTMLYWLLGGLALALIPAHINWLAERRHTDSLVSKSYFPGIFESFIFAGEKMEYDGEVGGYYRPQHATQFPEVTTRDFNQDITANGFIPFPRKASTTRRMAPTSQWKRFPCG